MGRRIDVDHNLACSAGAAGALAAVRREIAGDLLELPLLPNVAAEVLASSVDDRTNAARLAALIQQDQSLVGHVLRVVNSPAFRGAVEIVALQQAIARLGMARIREIALSASLAGILLRGGPYQVHADQSWRVSLAAGLWAKELARVARKNVEMAYLCGLLHDIGTPVVLHRLGALAGDLDAGAVAAACAELAGPAGLRLARAWMLPEPVAAVIAHREGPAGTSSHPDMVAVTVCAAQLARALGTGLPALDEVIEWPEVAHLNLYPEDVEVLLARQDDIRRAMESMVV